MIRTAVVLAILQLIALPPIAALSAADQAAAPKSSASQNPAPQDPATTKEVPGPRNDFDWSEWQRLPVQHDGRLKPLDTLADEIVTLVTGRSKWADPDVKDAAAYRAPELLYCWITRPDEWIDRPVLRCEYRPLRQILTAGPIKVSVDGTYVSVGQILDWKKSKASGRAAYWSKDIEDRLALLDRSRNKSPDSVGETSEDRAINGKLAELFKHIDTFLSIQKGKNVFIVPGLDPRALTRQTNPDERVNAWISLSALLAPDKWKEEGDVDFTIAAIMAEDPRELARELLSDRGYPEDHPSSPTKLVSMVPQLAQAQKMKNELQVEIRGVKDTLVKTRQAYDANDASEFSSSMHAFVEQVRRLARAMEDARTKMTPPEKGSITFGDKELDEAIWSRFKPLPLSQSQMSFSDYPAPGSTDLEIVYNKFQPFRTAWIVFLGALLVVVVSAMLKSSRLVYSAGLAITLAALVYSAWGFGMRIAIAGRPPVTNMYETVIWASFIVSLLGTWFCLLPLVWPGLTWAWRLAGMPIYLRKEPGAPVPRLALDRLLPEDQGKLLAGALLPVQCLASIGRLALFAATVWFFTRSGTSFRIIEFAPPIYGKAVALSSLGTWLVGMITVVGSAWFGSRAAMAVALSLITIVPEAARQAGHLWEQTFQRRYFLMGALPVACFGMLLASYVGNSSPDIMNPRIGSITAVLRNNYWLTIHVLTIVSSYGAGGLAWGLGNLAMLFYLFGKYRNENGTVPATTAGSPRNGGPVFDLNETYGNREGSLASRLQKAGKALKPSMLSRTIKAGFEDFGSGDEHLKASHVRPPKEVSTLANFTYKGQQVAVLLLAAGTILGGLWADVSWGQFWGWDPKEVWALISLLAYLVVLHGRFAGWVGTFGTNAGGVLAFTAILFSWYGVNFVLPMVHGWLNGTNMPTEVGLHAYAVGSGGLGYVAGAVVLNLMLVLAAWARYAAETTDLLTRPAETKPGSTPALDSPAAHA